MRQPNKIFRAFTVTAPKGRIDRIITAVKVCVAFDPESPPATPPRYFESKALWDTGATNSVLTKATVSALGLIPVGTTTVQHAGGNSTVNTYLVNIALPNNVNVTGVLVSECENTADSFGVIIGMDIITQGDFAITNVGGNSCVSYRYPSIDKIDYVEQAHRAKFANTKPNDPCPCGKIISGKPAKYKKCCGRVKSVN